MCAENYTNKVVLIVIHVIYTRKRNTESYSIIKRMKTNKNPAGLSNHLQYSPDLESEVF